jgi:hypothetical protein
MSRDLIPPGVHFCTIFVATFCSIFLQTSSANVFLKLFSAKNWRFPPFLVGENCTESSLRFSAEKCMKYWPLGMQRLKASLTTQINIYNF